MDAELADLLQRFGYLAVFLGTLLEGETVMLMAGFAVHQGYLDLPLVILAAFAGGLTGDQCLFALGRWRGAWLLDRFPRLRRPAAKATELLEKIAKEGLFTAIEKGIFADVKRAKDGGKGLAGVAPKGLNYCNPIIDIMLKKR